MQSNAYRVILTGEILDDFNYEDVVQAAAKLFKCSADRARQTLNGKPSPLKKIMDHNTAQSYQAQLRKYGIACRLEAAPVVKQNASLELEKEAPRQPTVPRTQTNVVDSEPASSGFTCPKCRTPQEPSAECIYCGIIFSKYRAANQAQPDLAGSGLVTTSAAEPVVTEMTELDEIAFFVGDGMDRYRYPFHQLHHNGGKYQLQWHWPAFLIPLPWMIYRKLYIYAGIYAVLFVLLPWYLLLPFSFAPGFLGYYGYYRHAQRQIDKITEFGEQRRDAISMAGGTNSISITIGSSILAGFILSLLFYSLHVQPKLEQVIERTTADVKQATTISNPGVQPTKVKMALLKTSLLMQRKLKLSIGDKFHMPNNMDEMQETLGLPSKADTDAWGTRLRFTVEGETLVFTSAGPDHVFNNDDDIVLRATE